MLRAALVRLVRGERASTALDLEAAVAWVAEGRPLTDLPQSTEPTTHRGATVIADVGGAMLPYLADVSMFVGEVSHAVGEPNTSVRWVDDSTWVAPETFELGRPVLVVSTLGAVRPRGEPAALRQRWLEFAEQVELVEADVVALVPHRLRGWPEPIARAMRLVTWDDLADVGRGHE